MFLSRLVVHDLRSLAAVDLEPVPGLNLLVGANGAGKTSVLEAIHLLSRGRSFRAGGDDALLRRGADGYSVYAETRDRQGRQHRLGLGHTAGRWETRVDGEPRPTLGELLAHCAVVCFEPGSHELLNGGAQSRRRFLDWGVFHVEQSYLDLWRRYQRALKQRNRLLRDGASAPELGAWEHELSTTAQTIDRLREAYVQAFAGDLAAEVARLVPQLGGVSVQYRRGWSDDVDLAEYLAVSRPRDLARGHTGAGPHRADWRLIFDAAPTHAHLSRGQEKLAALACMFAQAMRYVAEHGEWPVVCLDDLASELDASHRVRVLARLRETGAQTWITGTAPPDAGTAPDARVFHVEHGCIHAD